MFKKELVDVLKQTAWFVAAVCLLPGLLILSKVVSGPYSDVFAPTLQAGLAFWSVFLGASLFGRERGQGAVEYALSFPYSRFGLLARLAGPRLVVLAALLIAAWAMGFVPPVLIAAVCLPLFLISLSLSTVIENFIALCLISFGGWYALAFVVFRLIWNVPARSVSFGALSAFMLPRTDLGPYGSGVGTLIFVIQILFPILPFLVALAASFPRFDVRRSAAFRKRYGLAFVSCLVLGALLLPIGRAVYFEVLGTRDYKGFDLTRDLTLVEWKSLSKTIHIHTDESTRKARLDSRMLWPYSTVGNALYFNDIQGDIWKLDLSTERSFLLRKYSSGQGAFWNFWLFDSMLAFVEKGSRPDEIQLVLVDERTNQRDRRAFIHPSFRIRSGTLIGTGLRDGARYWLWTVIDRSKKSSFRLWDDGRVEEILVKGRLETVNGPYVVNGLLIFSGPEPLFVLQDNGKSYELKKEFPEDAGFYAWDGLREREILDPPAVPFIYGKRGQGQLARMNMTTLEIEDLGAWSSGGDDSWGYVFRKMGRAYFIGGSRAKKDLSVYALDEGGMRLIRSFPDMDIDRQKTRYEIFDSGIVLSKGNRIGVYAFPDLRELKFQGVANLK
jgi:hypothetical protein